VAWSAASGSGASCDASARVLKVGSFGVFLVT
jgi:hypothetical protein